MKLNITPLFQDIYINTFPPVQCSRTFYYLYLPQKAHSRVKEKCSTEILKAAVVLLQSGMIPSFLMSTITSMPITKTSAIKYDMYNDRYKFFFLTILLIYYIIIRIIRICFITFTEHD